MLFPCLRASNPVSRALSGAGCRRYCTSSSWMSKTSVAGSVVICRPRTRQPGPPSRTNLMHTRCALTMLLSVLSTPALAQSFMPLPNQLSLGVGVVGDRQLGQHAPAGILSFAFADSGNDYWPYRLGLLFEGELGAMSDAGPCQARDAQFADPPNCEDAALLVGTRFHLLRRSARRVLPFVNGLLGSYWTGSGAEDHEYQSQHLTVQAGGGIDLRRARSVHGLRLSVDYRRVFASSANRNQLRFVTSYVLGPPEPESPPAAPRVPGT
jgi:hypothetical protein